MFGKFSAPPPPPSSDGNRGQKKQENQEPLTYQEEIAHIFKTTLTFKHSSDPTILSVILKYVECRHAGDTGRAVGITATEVRNLLKYKDVAEAVQKVAGLSAEKYGFGAEELVQRVYEMVDFDPRELYNDDGTFKHLKDLPAHIARNVKKFDCKNLMEKDPNGMETGRMIGQVMHYEFYDRMDATKLLGREKELFKETKRVEHNVTNTMNEMLIAGLKRAQDQRAIAMRDVTPSEGDNE